MNKPKQKGMNFKRKRTPGRSARVYKEWYDETKQYRITWRNEVAGVATTPAYHACVLCQRPDGKEYWDFAERRAPYRHSTRLRGHAKQTRSFGCDSSKQGKCRPVAIRAG